MPIQLMQSAGTKIHAGVVSTIQELYGEDITEMKLIPCQADAILQRVRDRLTEKGLRTTPANVLAYAYIENYGGGAIVKLK